MSTNHQSQRKIYLLIWDCPRQLVKNYLCLTTFLSWVHERVIMQPSALHHCILKNWGLRARDNTMSTYLPYFNLLEVNSLQSTSKVYDLISPFRRTPSGQILFSCQTARWWPLIVKKKWCTLYLVAYFCLLKTIPVTQESRSYAPPGTGLSHDFHQQTCPYKSMMRLHACFK